MTVPDAWSDKCSHSIFPFELYPRQRALIASLFGVLDSGSFGVLESPTGSGKTACIISAALRWIQESRVKKLANGPDTQVANGPSGSAPSSAISIPSWVRQQHNEVMRASAESTQEIWAAQKSEARSRVERALSGLGSISANRAGGVRPGGVKHGRASEGLRDDDCVQESDLEDVTLERTIDSRPKVIIATRTHSQVSHIVNEFKKIKSSSPGMDGLTVIPLGGRSHLCVNEAAVNSSDVNISCLKMHKKKECQYYSQAHVLKDSLVASTVPKVIDVEELKTIGSQSNVNGCPYYGVRMALPHADIVVSPYSYVLNASQRTSVGLDLKGSVVIFDEAHNILDLIGGMSSCTLTGTELVDVATGMSSYVKRFATTMAPATVMRLRSIGALASRLSKLDLTQSGDRCDIGNFVRQVEGLVSSELNIASIVKFAESKTLAMKFRWHVDWLQRQPPSETMRKISSMASMEKFVEFLRCVLNSNKHDVIVSSNADSVVSFRLIVVSVYDRLAEVASMTSGMALVGGTMKPFEEFGFVAKLSKMKFHCFESLFQFNERQVRSYIVGADEAGLAVKYTFEERNSCSCVTTACRVLVTAAQTARAGTGVVAFLPSTEYLMTIMKSPELSGLRARTALFIDGPDGKGTALFEKFRSSVRHEKSLVSVLLSVCGGSLAEGVDFKDDLCRCLIVIGLPYPNIGDPDIAERMKYMDQLAVARADCEANNGSQTNVGSEGSHTRTYLEFNGRACLEFNGRAYLECKCMRLVNQAIGRSVRHQDDWSSVVLVDSRFPSKVGSLPKWMPAPVSVSSVTSLRAELERFVASRFTS